MAVKALNLDDLFSFNLSNIFGQASTLIWKRKEVALLLLGKFSTDIVASYTEGEAKGQVPVLINSLMGILTEKDINPMCIHHFMQYSAESYTP